MIDHRDELTCPGSKLAADKLAISAVHTLVTRLQTESAADWLATYCNAFKFPMLGGDGGALMSFNIVSGGRDRGTLQPLTHAV